MSNIHRLSDYQNAPPSRPAVRQGNYYSRPASSSHAAPPLDSGLPERGISMMAAPPDPNNPIPELHQYIFIRANKKTFIAILSLIQVIMFIVTLIVGATKYDGAFVKDNTGAGPSAETLHGMGGKWTDDIRNHYEIHRLFMPILLHAGILHLLGNIFFQLRIGFVLEARWGIPRLAGLYLLTGLGASLWSAVLSPTSVSVGASGALFGMIGADLAYLYLNWEEIPHRAAELCFMMFVLLINFLLGTAPNIDVFAHVGGLVTGLLAGPAVLEYLVPYSKEKTIRIASGALCGGVLLLFCLLLWVGDPLN